MATGPTLAAKHPVLPPQLGAARKHSPPSQKPTLPVPQTVPSAKPAQTSGAGVVVVVVVVGVTHPPTGSTTSPSGQTASPGPHVPGGRQRELPFP